MNDDESNFDLDNDAEIQDSSIETDFEPDGFPRLVNEDQEEDTDLSELSEEELAEELVDREIDYRRALNRMEGFVEAYSGYLSVKREVERRGLEFDERGFTTQNNETHYSGREDLTDTGFYHIGHEF